MELTQSYKRLRGYFGFCQTREGLIALAATGSPLEPMQGVGEQHSPCSESGRATKLGRQRPRALSANAKPTQRPFQILRLSKRSVASRTAVYGAARTVDIVEYPAGLLRSRDDCT
jgi:hypothetical protein